MFPPFSTTGIGSLPHTNAEAALRLVLGGPDIPFWPQLPSVSFLESMIPQFTEGMPGVRIDAGRETVRVEKSEPELSAFYQNYSEELELPVSESFSAGFAAFSSAVEGKRFQFLKGQITGPLTFTLGLKDSDNKFIHFDEELREIALLVLKAKVRWQVNRLKRFAPAVVIFIDEPIMSALGSSSYLGVSSQESLRMLREIAVEIEKTGAVAGIHCCGKADWPLLIDSGVKIISFDAYDYIGSISLFPAEFTGFLRNGGYLAWGIVPATEAIQEENASSLLARFDEGMHLLSHSMPADLLRRQILLTPSCGTASRTVEETEKVFRLLAQVQDSVKEKFIR
jgi:methionine synthase II (cobalamin-independent)